MKRLVKLKETSDIGYITELLCYGCYLWQSCEDKDYTKAVYSDDIVEQL
jgi:hypothetical protein